jgi:heat shock protein HslJ
MNKRILALLVVALAIVAGACSDNLPPQNTAAAPFEGILWRLVSIDRNGATQAVDREISIRFDAGSFSGSGPCNPHGGSYTATNAALTISGFTSGDAPCVDADLEESYFAALQGVESFQASETTLRLYASGGSVVLNYVKATSVPVDTVRRNVPFVDKVWLLTKIEMGGAVETVDTTARVTLRFSSEMQYSGGARCTPYFGLYAHDTVGLRVVSVERLNEPCDFDRRYFELFKGARAYRSTDSTLDIQCQGGTLHYVPLRGTPRPRENAPIVGKEWRLRQISDGDRIESVSTEHGIALVFATPQSYNGLGACNRYGGPYNATPDGRIEIMGVNEPGLLCPERGLEERYLGLLRKASEYWSSETALKIVCAGGAVLHYEKVAPGATPPPIADTLVAGSTWKLLSITLRNGGTELPPKLTTLSFGPRTLEGDGPCNHYTASYVARDGVIAITDFAHTELACADQAFETTYFESLPNGREFSIGAERLVIVTPAATFNYVRHR